MEGGASGPYGRRLVDGADNIWIASGGSVLGQIAVTGINNAGNLLNSYGGHGLDHPNAVAIDTLDEVRACSHYDHMRKSRVGARELKTRLGTYLRQVRQGRTLVVTDRGQPVAELRPITSATGVDAVIARLIASGHVTRISNQRLRPIRPVAIQGKPASATVVEDRIDRF